MTRGSSFLRYVLCAVAWPVENSLSSGSNTSATFIATHSKKAFNRSREGEQKKNTPDKLANQF